MSKRLALSKEIQIDALEMVRRAEFALGKAIRKGQEEGEIATKCEMSTYAIRTRHNIRLSNSESYVLGKPKPSDFAPARLLSGNGAGIYHLADGVEPEQFEAALAEAKAEGNVSRANVVRKVKGEPGERFASQQVTGAKSLGFGSPERATGRWRSRRPGRTTPRRPPWTPGRSRPA